MVAGVHGNMEAAPKHAVADNRMEEEHAQIQLQNMEVMTAWVLPLILGVVIWKAVQVRYTN